MTLTAAQVKAEARQLGFVACGVTDLAPNRQAHALDTWLARGYAGTMRYIHRQAKKRKDPRLIDTRAIQAIVVADNYYYQGNTDPLPRIARFARGVDYHEVTGKRLNELAAFLRQNGAHVARPYVDHGPVPERELGARAGLGWIGKNTMLIRTDLGSWFFIGSIFTDLALEVDSPNEADHCGSCTRCLDACPTTAFVEPRVLDATRCISYLTIEQRGPIPPDLLAHLEGWGFGCDICNDVCPWNERFARQSTVAEFAPQSELTGAAPDYFERMDETEFAARFGETALQRPGLEGMRRNWRAARQSVTGEP